MKKIIIFLNYMYLVEYEKRKIKKLFKNIDMYSKIICSAHALYVPDGFFQVDAFPQHRLEQVAFVLQPVHDIQHCEAGRLQSLL